MCACAAHEVVRPTRAEAKYGRKTGTAAACVAVRTVGSACVRADRWPAVLLCAGAASSWRVDGRWRRFVLVLRVGEAAEVGRSCECSAHDGCLVEA